MLKLFIMFVVPVLGMIISGSYIWKLSPPQIKISNVDSKNKNLMSSFNTFAKTYPSKKMTELVKNLQWILNHDYKRDIRVKRIIHQDIKNLMDMAFLCNKLEGADTVAIAQYDKSFASVLARTQVIRNKHDLMARDKILLLGELIEDNERFK